MALAQAGQANTTPKKMGQAEHKGRKKWVRLLVVAAVGIVLASLVSGAGALARIGIFAMTPWAVAGGLKMASE